MVIGKAGHNTPMEAQGGEDVELLLIHDLNARWGWVVNIMPWPCFTAGERTPVPIVQEAEWAPESIWT
jgi:hypothetical protein